MTDPNFPGHQYFATPGPAPVPGDPQRPAPMPSSLREVQEALVTVMDYLARIGALYALVTHWEQRGKPYSERASYEYADGVANAYHDAAVALRAILDGPP